MAKVSSGLTLSTDYFMRSFYTSNRNVIKKSGRSDYSKIELSFEDSRALSRATRHLMKSSLGSDDEQDSELSDTIKSTIEAFVNTYNNAVDTADTDDHDTKRYLKQMKTLTQKYSDELEDIGISINNDGTLALNKDRMKLADTSKVHKVFSGEQGFSKKALSLSKKLNTAVQNHILSQMTGSGLHINITL